MQAVARRPLQRWNTSYLSDVAGSGGRCRHPTNIPRFAEGIVLLVEKCGGKMTCVAQFTRARRVPEQSRSKLSLNDSNAVI
jgi:hypothetical protein